jgi:methylglutaconyl-CoA hydratase
MAILAMTKASASFVCRKEIFMGYDTLLIEKKGSALHVTLNRPEVRNAFNEKLIAELDDVFSTGALSDDIHVVVLSGKGKSFCAGGDIKWMKDSMDFTHENNFQDARKLSAMFEKINSCPKPVIATVHGAALGGGVGLVSICDYVIATKETIFSLSEVRLGLIPACIGPFVINKVGESHARALFLSADRFDTHKAWHIGLIHQVVKDEDELKFVSEKMVHNMLSCSPQALKVAKKFIHDLRKKSWDEKHICAAQTLADLRVTPEAQEGLTAFLEKRKPSWDKS